MFFNINNNLIVTCPIRIACDIVGEKADWTIVFFISFSRPSCVLVLRQHFLGSQEISDQLEKSLYIF